MVAKGAGGKRGINREFGTNRCKLVYIEWINTKVLLYSKENYIQYPVIHPDGKEYDNECVCMCVYIYTHTYIHIYMYNCHLP